MADDVLRLRATVVSDEALANIRAIGREIGILPQKVAPGLKTLDTGFSGLSKTVKQLGGELMQLAPALTSFGLGAGGAGLAAGILIKTLGGIADRIVQLKYVSKELGMSERDIRAWQVTAEKAGIAPEAMLSGLRNFGKTMSEFKYNMGAGFDELIARGAGPVVQRMKAAGTEADKLKVAFDFKDALMKADPTGFKARQFFELIGLGADAARLSLEQWNKTRGNMKELTPEEVERAQKFKDAMVELGRAWEELSTKAGLALFPGLTEDIKNITKLLDMMHAASEWLSEHSGMSFDRPKIPGTNIPIPGAPPIPNITPLLKGALSGATKPDGTPLPTPPPSFAPNPLLQQRRGGNPGIKLMSFGDGADLTEGSRMVKEGVFAALVDFQNYTQAGGPGAATAGGFTNASFGGSAGAAAGGGFRSAGGFNVVPNRSGPTFRPGVGPGARGGPSTPGQGPFKVGRGGDPRGMEGYIRETAAKYGIDPDTAMRVASSEGLGTFLGDHGKSGGAFQLFTGGGLGNEFQRATGLNPLDPANEKATIDFALKHASTHGWGAFHGAKRVGVGPREGLPGGTTPNGQARGARVGVDGKTTGGSFPERVQAVGGEDPAAFITHHTGGRGTVAGVQETLRQRGLGVQYVMDREGNITLTGGPGSKQIQRGSGMGAGLSNANTVGMEIIAKNDKDVTPAQAAAYAQFMKARYPNTPIFGHGEVNPGHKEATEGLTAKRAAEALRAQRIDGAINTASNGGARAEGSVNVNVTHNGTAARTSARTDGDLFQKSTITNYKQGQPTERPATFDMFGEAR